MEPARVMNTQRYRGRREDEQGENKSDMEESGRRVRCGNGVRNGCSMNTERLIERSGGNRHVNEKTIACVSSPFGTDWLLFLLLSNEVTSNLAVQTQK